MNPSDNIRNVMRERFAECSVLICYFRSNDLQEFIETIYDHPIILTKTFSDIQPRRYKVYDTAT